MRPGPFAQIQEPHRQRLTALLSLLLAAVPAAWAQDGGTRVSASVGASVSHVETRRERRGDEADTVLELRPGVDVSSRSGRLRGVLRYSLGLVQHTASSRDPEAQHSLAAELTAEAVDNFAFVDASASIARRAVSAYGVQAEPNSPQDDGNQTDVARVSVRPHIRGVLGGVVSYNVGAQAAATRTRKSALGDVDESGATVALGSARGGMLGWGLHATRQRTKFLTGRATVDERVTASLNLRPDVDWVLTIRGGQESTDVASLDKRRYDNWGAGLRWTPSPRTLLSADIDERYFGRSWALVLEHRFALSALRLTSTRGASSSGNAGGAITVYDLLDDRYKSVQPDPVLRDLFVLSILQSLGITDRNTRVPGGSLSNAVSLQRRTDLGWTYTGARLTLALLAFASDTEILDTLAPQLGDGPVSQRGLLATAAWRLSPTAAANVTLSQLWTASNRLRGGTHLTSLAVAVSERVGVRTTASVSARHSQQGGGPDPYQEAAVGVTLNHRF